MSNGLAVITVVHGRHPHLFQQERSLRSSSRPPDHRVVVAMDDPAVEADQVVRLGPGPDGRLPLAAARNAGARRALELGADRLVFLDVDCLVARGALAGYDDAMATGDPVVWSGPVTYLRAVDRPYPVDDLDRLDDPHPARPDPGPGKREVGDRWELFWSLSFALTATAWERAGGFDEAYTGYGGEDTDFGQRARRSGLSLGWTGDARAYHQHHPAGTTSPERVEDVVRNGRLFADRWGWWPMGGWLDDLERAGRVRRDGDGWQVVRLDAGTPT